MNIEQTCKITLTPEEVREALTGYIREQNRYRSNFRRYDVVLSYLMWEEKDGPVTVLWGEAPAEEREEDAETAAIKAVRAEAAIAAAPTASATCECIAESTTPSEPAF